MMNALPSLRLPSLALLVGLSLIGGAAAQHVAPRVDIDPAPATVTVGGRQFVNQGLVGVGRLPANLRDGMGDTLGSFSGLAADGRAWRREGDGYAGRIVTLPDRGYNDPASGTFADYAARLQTFDIRFAPGTGELTLRYAGTLPLRDADGTATTGYDPGAGTGERFGLSVPIPPPGGQGGGRLTIDAEAMAVRADGDFYVSDEYRPGIYLFAADGRLKGIVPVPQALQPETDGATNFNSLKPPMRGRRNNQGLEGLSLTPDGRYLMALLQSGTVQDATADQATRNHTRLLVYDLSATALPTAPVGHYVVRLPTFRLKGDGAPPDRTAAASEILALDASTVLMLARDGTGYGNESPNPLMYKNVQLLSLAGATNLAGTAWENGYQPVSPGGMLDPSITAAMGADFVNLLNVTQLGRFGINLNAGKAADRMTLSEKWEALGLLPVLDPARPADMFLLVGNDNDFATRDGVMQGRPYDAGVENDNLILVYRLTLPR